MTNKKPQAPFPKRPQPGFRTQDLLFGLLPGLFTRDPAGYIAHYLQGKSQGDARKYEDMVNEYYRQQGQVAEAEPPHRFAELEPDESELDDTARSEILTSMVRYNMWNALGLPLDSTRRNSNDQQTPVSWYNR